MNSDAAVVRSSGIDAKTGEWAPAFPGQRRPFPKGHTFSMVSGANSERVVGPLAEKLAADMLEDPQPPYLAHPLLRGLLIEYARARAKQRLQEQVLDAIGWPGIADYDEEETQEPPFHVPLWQRRRAAYSAWTRAFTRSITLSGKLGLSPLTQATAPDDALWRRAAAECGDLDWQRPPIPPP